MARTSKMSLLFMITMHISKGVWHPQHNIKQETFKCNFTFACVAINGLKTWAATTSHTPWSRTSCSVLIGENSAPSGISSFISMASSILILTSSVPSTSQVTHVSLQEPVSPSTKSRQFCNTTKQIDLSNHIQQDTSITSTLHCIKFIQAVCPGFLHKQFKNMTNNLHGDLSFLTWLWLLH